MNLEIIRNELEKLLAEHSYHLFDLNYEKSNQILSVVIDESLSMDEIELISKEIFDFMDNYDQDMDAYYLDVTTVGVERPIRNSKEIEDALGAYIYVKTDKDEYNGYLDSYDDKTLNITYLNKNIEKHVAIKEEEIKEMRYAVNFKGE